MSHHQVHAVIDDRKMRQQSCERTPSRSRGALEIRVRQGKICEQDGGGKRNNSGVRRITNHHRHKKGLRDPHSVKGLNNFGFSILFHFQPQFLQKMSKAQSLGHSFSHSGFLSLCDEKMTNSAKFRSLLCHW